MAGETITPPPGFERGPAGSPFLDLIGPLWWRRASEDFELGLCIDERHHNRRGNVHGGVLAALADVALIRAASQSQDPPIPLTTVSLTIDYAGAVRDGEFVIATVEVTRVGRRLAFANCRLRCDGRPVGQASAVLAAVE